MNTRKKSKSATSIIIAQTPIEAMMHGVAWYSLPLKKGNVCTAVYTDGTKESAEIPSDLAEEVRAYYSYANEGGAICECPSGFRLVSAIHSNRATVSNT